MDSISVHSASSLRVNDVVGIGFDDDGEDIIGRWWLSSPDVVVVVVAAVFIDDDIFKFQKMNRNLKSNPSASFGFVRSVHLFRHNRPSRPTDADGRDADGRPDDAPTTTKSRVRACGVVARGTHSQVQLTLTSNYLPIRCIFVWNARFVTLHLFRGNLCGEFAK